MRERALVEATRLFAAQGLGGTSLQQIADAVGVRKPSLLYHFGSKDELHAAVLDALLARWNETLPRLLRAVARDDRFDAVLDETIAFFASDPDRARLLLREALDRPEHMRALLGKHVAPWLEVIADGIRKGGERGFFHADVDPEAYVVQVIQLVVAGCATAGSVATIATGSRSVRVPPRIVREMKRVARAALFAPARMAGEDDGERRAAE